MSVARGVRSYLIGLGLAVLLTIASFWAAQTHVIYGPGIPVAIVVLALAQMGIHLVFFLHITTAPDNTNNVLALAFGILIACLVIFGSLWIMANLNHNMMPAAHMGSQAP
ncbi:MAG: cytochrome o ubiquinol oxidase subunit IV [Steroidobacteraceae bacterium]